jgi:hypothetical protein
MRCYFMRNGHIAAVELLEEAADDREAIKQGSARFLGRLREGFEGFEIWERDRMVFRYPEEEKQADPTSNSGKSSPPSAAPRRSKKGLSQPVSCAGP